MSVHQISLRSERTVISRLSLSGPRQTEHKMKFPPFGFKSVEHTNNLTVSVLDCPQSTHFIIIVGLDDILSAYYHK